MVAMGEYNPGDSCRTDPGEDCTDSINASNELQNYVGIHPSETKIIEESDGEIRILKTLLQCAN